VEISPWQIRKKKQQILLELADQEAQKMMLTHKISCE
jgi:hypothetical protein